VSFIQYLWQRSEYYTKFSMIYFICIAVLTTISFTYESKNLYLFTQAMIWFYVAYMFGYEIAYKSLREKYERFQKEQNELFDNIKDPK